MIKKGRPAQAERPFPKIHLLFMSNLLSQNNCTKMICVFPDHCIHIL